MDRIQFISDEDCRKDMGGYGLQRWYRLEKRFAAFLPPVIVISGHKFRDRALWERFKRMLIADSDPAKLREGPHRALAASQKARAAREAAKIAGDPATG
jgi:hypothetical protein